MPTTYADQITTVIHVMNSTCIHYEGSRPEYIHVQVLGNMHKTPYTTGKLQKIHIHLTTSIIDRYIRLDSILVTPHPCRRALSQQHSPKKFVDTYTLQCACDTGLGTARCVDCSNRRPSSRSGLIDHVRIYFG